MKHLLRSQLVNRSDQNRFRFSITCLECGEKWTSTPENKKEVFWNEDFARDRAAEEAMQLFCVCPICGHIVCQSCFVACGDLHMCQACSIALNQHERTINR